MCPGNLKPSMKFYLILSVHSKVIETFYQTHFLQRPVVKKGIISGQLRIRRFFLFILKQKQNYKKGVVCLSNFEHNVVNLELFGKTDLFQLKACTQ